GLIVGFMFIHGMKRREERNDLERKDLEAKRDALIAQLRAEPDAEERTRLEGEAAATLRKLDGFGVGAGALAGTAAGESPAATHGGLKGFLWGAGSVAVLAAIGFFVTQSSKPKENADSVAQLEQAVQKSPSDLTLRDDLAKVY